MQNMNCAQIIRTLQEDVSRQESDIVPFLQDSYRRFRHHPCFPEIEREIGSILTSFPDPEVFLRFFSSSDVEPDSLVNQILDQISDLIRSRDFQSAAERMKYLLPVGMIEWPESTRESETRAFRDLVEYLFYMVVCEPEREVVIRSFTQTNILYHNGLILLGMRNFGKALDILRNARRQSPVHSGILNAIASAELSMIRSDMAYIARKADLSSLEQVIGSSLRFAWLEEELAQAFRNQGSLLALKEDVEAAIACFLMAETWDGGQDGKAELDLLIGTTAKDIDPDYYITHGTEILSARGIQPGPDPEMITLLIRIADDYLEEQNFFKGREYLIHAYQLSKREDLQDRIWRIERFIEDSIEF